jgi:phytoene dehydrogenase-like protein/NAD-dependent dihydropyrimidine dehydrogenase PreA subunit
MNITTETSRCTGCSYCIVTCPTHAITLQVENRAWPVIDQQACIRCGECLYICPNGVFSDPDLVAPPVELENEYDAMVIGAGIGGLMTAAGLARAGKKVLVLEQLSFLGGKYTHLNSPDGYAISTAAWTCPGPKSRIGQLCTKLGADIPWVTIKNTQARGDHWLYMKDGRRFSNLDLAQETFVGGKKGMAQVYRWIADMYDPSALHPQDQTARQYIEQFFPGNQQYVDYVQTIITYCFASQTVDHFSGIETARAIVDALENMKEWGTAVGGTAAVIAGLEQVVRHNGGTIATHTRVDSILLENGRAVGVRLLDGRTLRAAVTVHNGGLNRLIQLVGAENLPPQFNQRLTQAVPANVAAFVLGTNHSLLGSEHSLLHTMGWERTLNCYAPTFFDPKLAPEGKHLLDVFWVMEPPFNMKEEMDIVEAQLRQVFPDYDQAVDLKVPMFFTGAWTAEMAHRIGQSGTDRIDPQLPIPGLYMVGYDCIGYGMAGDIIPHGVERALHLILNDPLYAPVDVHAGSKFTLQLKTLLFRLMAAVTR